MSKLKINHYVVGPVQTNCYFAINEETHELLVIDPGANAKQLETLAANDAGMMLALGNPDSWSLKYNMVWDTVAGFNLFSADVRKTEIATYVKRANPYGVPLDSRKEFTKSDWMMWASALDDTDENTRFMSRLLTVFLDNTRDRVP